MWNCEEALERISAELDGALPPEEQTALDEHLRSCAACRALRAELAGLHAALPVLDEIPAPEGFADSVMRAVSESAQEPADNVIPFSKKTRRSPWKGWTAAAAAFAVVVLGIAAGNGAWGGFAKTVDSAAVYNGAANPQVLESSAVSDTISNADSGINSNADISTSIAVNDTAEFSSKQSVPDEDCIDCNGDDVVTVDLPAAVDCYEHPDLGLTYRAVLTISGGSAPDWLMEEYEFTQNGAVQSCILPAQELYALAQELELTLEELDPDAEYSLLLVTES